MAYSGMPTDTSVAFMERTMQMKIHVRQSFFVGEGKWFLDFAKKYSLSPEKWNLK